MKCHQCGACCTEISISSNIPGMGAKPAGIRCIHLGDDRLCALFGKPDRPTVCSSFQANVEICGTNEKEAISLIRWYEKETS